MQTKPGAIHLATPDDSRNTPATYLFNVTVRAGVFALVAIAAPAFNAALAFVRGLYPWAHMVEDWDVTESAPDFVLS